MSEHTASAQTRFYVAQGEQNLGPWTIEEIAAKVASQEIAVTDFVYDEGRQDWIPLLELEAFKAHLNKKRPKAPPPRAQETVRPEPVERASAAVVQTASREQTDEGPAEWFVQKGANRFGPMTYLEVVRALQEKTVFDFDFVWKQGTESWVRIAEHSEFHPDRIRELAGKFAGASEPKDVFVRRQYPRIRFESEVIVHDDRSVWMGQAFEAGLGGSGLVIENATLQPGQVVRVHFGPCDGLPAFNALGEIVGKRYTREVRGKKSPVRYALKFLKVDGAAEAAVREYFESKASS
mgnify:CR=1 FL=1